MKKILTLLFFSFILVACSNNDSNNQEEENEPVTKIIHECQCVVNDDSDDNETEDVKADEEETNDVMENDNEQENNEQEGTDDVMENDDDFELENEGELDSSIQRDQVNQENPANSGPTTYTVVAGDTLTRIAELFGVTASQIQSWNNLNSPDDLYVGQVLNILGGTHSGGSIPDINTGAGSIAEETINYILNGQEDKREADRLNWNEAFLRQVNITEIYQAYLDEGGEAGSVESFAQHLTLNAPILDNWEELFKDNFFQSYGIEITRVSPLGGDRYRAYVETNGVEVPEVIVSARTGYYSR